MSSNTTTQTFEQLGLSQKVLSTVEALGYQSPSPIQQAVIPYMLAGNDVLGQAQTGTGKTAAFALPLLSQTTFGSGSPKVLVLAPTRELAIQVAEAFKSYASTSTKIKVLSIYGGQDYSPQLRQLKSGVDIVVGTPGRIMDHLRRGTLKLDSLSTLILDEADEMLRMGFIDDVEWILSHIPADVQKALFSATMPRDIRRIAQKYLNNPKEVTIQSKTTTAEGINQRYWLAQGLSKFDALARILESETSDGILIFVRTKTATAELTEQLQLRGFSTAALNGDISQNIRERTIEQLKKGKIDIIVATDVAARGIDVPRISHVVNYDIPFDTESYVHRIGRTGRAGRTGEAILFVTPRERRLLTQIERTTKQKVNQMTLPDSKDINLKRIENFKQRIEHTIQSKDLMFYKKILTELAEQQELGELDMAAALADLMHRQQPLLLSEKKVDHRSIKEPNKSTRPFKDKPRNTKDHKKSSDESMETYRVPIGQVDGLQPGNLVGAIANEIKLNSKHIGRINIFDTYTTVDLPKNMPKAATEHLKKVWVAGKRLNIAPN